jgi:tRNA(adenine34) deaminase
MEAELYMKEALKQAQTAFELGEIPVGAVITQNGKIISTAYNKRETGKNALFHAETEAIYKACEALGGWRLWNCELYVTLEPCPMCAGAIVNARIPKVYFGAYDIKNGACGSYINLLDTEHNFRPEVYGGIMEEECSILIKNFFKKLRNS